MKYFYYLLTIMVMVLLLSNSAQHPTNPNGGFTSAPLDGTCNECHRNPNNNLSGSFSIEGLPEITFTETTYQIMVLIDNPDNDAVRAGFQLVGLESDLSNAGDWNSEDENVLIKRARQRNYIGHSPAKSFNEDRIAEWIIQWTPGTNDNGMNTIYGAGLIGSGTAGNSNDRAIFRQWNTTTYLPQDTLIGDINVERPISNCRGSKDGRLGVSIDGGIPPYNYTWNNGDTTSYLDSIGEGYYSITITDSIGNLTISERQLNITDPLIIDSLETTGITNQANPNGSIQISYKGGMAPYEVNWYNLELSEIIGTGDSTTDLTQGRYYAIVTDAVNCSVVSDTVLIQFNSSSKIILKDYPILYPNPSRGDFSINPNGLNIVGIELYDSRGNKINSQQFDPNKSTFRTDLAKGIYFVRMTIDNAGIPISLVNKLVILD